MPVKYIIVKHTESGLRYWNSVMEFFEFDPQRATKYDLEEEAKGRINTNPKIPIDGFYQVIPITIKK